MDGRIEIAMNENPSTRPTITLMTDFGLTDPYVGVMKGVILSIIPEVALVDLTHEIPPQDIQRAAFLLSTVIGYFPVGTVHTIVVDPEVGGERRPIAIRTRHAFFVAPDNGVLSMALARQPAEEIVHLTNPDYWLPSVSATFHGRDIFAPAAAHLARGVPLSDLGTPIQDIVRLPIPHPTRRPDGSILGRVQHIDRFGNCITNIPSEMLDLSSPVVVSVAGHAIQGIVSTYSSVEPGQPLSLVGSTDFLEIAVRNGNAARELGVKAGDTVLIEPR